MAKACNCASLGLAFTAIALFLMLLWASVQAVPASLETPHFQSNNSDLRSRGVDDATVGSNCTSLIDKLCQLFDDKVTSKRMKSRRNFRVRSHDDDDNNTNELIIKSSKDLHERQVRSFELNNKIIKNKHSPESYEKVKTNQDFIRNISLVGESVNEIINNGASVSKENISESTTLAFKESENVETNPQKEASDKVYLHVNGE